MPWRYWVAVLLAAAAIRFLFSAMENVMWVDSHAYLNSAQAFLDGRWRDFRVERVPGYPLLLAAEILLLKALGLFSEIRLLNLTVWLQSLLGMLTAPLAAALALKLFNRPKVALTAGLFIAISPNLIAWEHAMLTESLYTLGFTGLMLLLAFRQDDTGWRQDVTLGLLAAGLILIKPVAQLLLLMIGLWLLWRKQVKSLAVVAITALIPLSAWVGFQVQAHGYWGIAASAGQNQLYKTATILDWDSPLHGDLKQLIRKRLSVHPNHEAYQVANDAHVLLYQAQKDEKPFDEIYLAYDRQAGDISREAMLTHPFRYLGITLKETARQLWMPSDGDPRLLYWGPLLFFAVLGMAIGLPDRKRFDPAWLVAALFWAQLLIYPWVTVADHRYRVPVEPVAATFAALGASGLWRSHRGHRDQGRRRQPAGPD